MSLHLTSCCITLFYLARWGRFMAFSLKISAYINSSDAPIFTIDSPHGWDARKLMKDPRFTEDSLDGGYLDYYATLTITETQELYKQFRYSAMDITDKDILNFPSYYSIRQKCIKLDDAIMKHWWKFDSFTFYIYEWESGF